MSRVAYSRRECYDNIAVGSAITSQECVLPDLSGAKAGVTPPAVDRETFAHGENLVAIGSDTSIENFVDVAVDPTDERPGGA